MISNQLSLVRRELWEHRAIYITPLVIALVMSLMSLTGQVTISAFGQEVDLAIIGASSAGEIERQAAITAFLMIFTSIFALGAWILMIFYSLDALYAERRDKSILFWRSLPVTDSETVISKLLTAVLVIPMTAFAFVVVTHLLNLILWSIWLSIQGGDAGHLLWSAAPLFDNWAATLIIAVAMPLWLSPLIGWFLFVSAFTKRSPLLIAFLPMFVVPMLEKMVSPTSLFWDTIFIRSVRPPLFKGIDSSMIFDEDNFQITADAASLLAKIDLARFLSSPSMWLGLVVCGLFTTAAIYVRRYRDES
ncbi:MAG: ABC-2 transporter permease [Woeseiaceae bacterium]